MQALAPTCIMSTTFNATFLRTYRTAKERFVPYVFYPEELLANALKKAPQLRRDGLVYGRIILVPLTLRLFGNIITIVKNNLDGIGMQNRG